MAASDIEYKASDDAYAILGVNDVCDIDDIEKAYKRLVSLYLPEALPTIQLANEATKNMSRLQMAFDCLKEPTSRRAYDAKKVCFIGKRFYSMKDQRQDFQTYLKSFQNHFARQEAMRRAEFKWKLQQWRSTTQGAKNDKQTYEDGYCSDEDSLPDFVEAAVRELQMEKHAMAFDFHIWEEREKNDLVIANKTRKRDESVLRTRHELMMKVLEDGYRRKFRALEQALAHDQTLARQRHEAEFDRFEARQEIKVQAQEDDRKRVREQYHAWCEQVDAGIRYAKKSRSDVPAGVFKVARPNLHQSQAYAITKTGKPCKHCLRDGELCNIHTK